MPWPGMRDESINFLFAKENGDMYYSRSKLGVLEMQEGEESNENSMFPFVFYTCASTF